jgi:hypothetical protein
MTDFDEVLERLLSDPSFQSQLASDPDAALRSYSLNPDERDLLQAQLVTGPGGQHLVESRTTKSGVVGLLGPVAAAFGVAAGGASAGAQTLGGAGADQAFGAAPGAGSLGPAPLAGGGEALGDAPDTSDAIGLREPADVMGSAGEPTTVGNAPEATNYHTRVDVDGDGSWDRHTAYERADGGVDIHADADGDGVTDFVGHDYDRDGLVDEAEFDNDHDGVMETRMYDDTGDGWMDRSEAIAVDGEPQAFGSAPN